MKIINNIFILFFLLSQIIFAEQKIYRDNSILFSIKGSAEPLSIDNNFFRTNHKNINTFLNEYNIIKIEPWLKSATEKDFDGDIYLNRIYRIKFDAKSKNRILDAIDDLKKISDVQYVERENLHRIFYTPNDSQYNQQWFLPDINSNDAWDFWDIDGNEVPGDKQIILAALRQGGVLTPRNPQTIKF